MKLYYNLLIFKSKNVQSFLKKMMNQYKINIIFNTEDNIALINSTKS